MIHHQDIQSIEESAEQFPLPWRIHMESGECWGIIASNGRQVVETDSGFYPPDKYTALRIVAAINHKP